MNNSRRIGLGAKLVLIFIAVLIGIFIVNQPSQAAEVTGNIGSALSTAGNGVGAFLGSLFN
jgi:hypothetical protein